MLELEYASRDGVRVAGWLTLILGGLSGAGVMLVPLLTSSNDFVVPLIAGGVIVFVAEIVGLAMVYLNDHADIRQRDSF